MWSFLGCYNNGITQVVDLCVVSLGVQWPLAIFKCKSQTSDVALPRVATAISLIRSEIYSSYTRAFQRSVARKGPINLGFKTTLVL